MTTIAYRYPILAGDTLETADDLKIHGHVKKVWRMKDGSLFGAAGASEHCEMVRQSVSKGHAPPVLDDIEALWILPGGKVRLYEGRIWTDLPRSKNGFHAIGSGRVAAMVAMYHGADARQAVKTAMKFNAHTGGNVTSVSLGKKKKK